MIHETRQADWSRTATAADNTIVSQSESGVSGVKIHLTELSANYDDPTQIGYLRLFGLETINGAKGYVGPFDASSASVVNLTNDTITVAGHGLTNTDKVVYHNGGGTSITNLTSGTMYFVVGVSGNIFQLSLTSGGAAINLAGTQASLGTAQYILKLGKQWALAGELALTFYNPLIGGAGMPMNLQVSEIASTQGFLNYSGYTKF